jgi:hypothetical protein
MIGIEMTEKEKADWQKAFTDIKESIEQVMKNGEDL